MADAARRLEAAGADPIVLTTNTMHRVHDAIEAAVTLPFLHIADPTGNALRAAGVESVALLGTRYTMELPFYAQRLRDRFGLDVRVPDEPRAPTCTGSSTTSCVTAGSTRSRARPMSRSSTNSRDAARRSYWAVRKSRC
jgi:hypothetical protein